MKINFDKQVDRVGTDSAKWDIPCSKYGSDIIGRGYGSSGTTGSY